MSEMIFCQTFGTPCGELILQSVAGKLICCDWSDGWHRATIARRLERAFPHASCLEREDEVIAQTKRQLTEYFAGMRKTFDVPLRFIGTDFQHAVWQELLKLPYGTLTTYGEIARRIGRPGSVRAVGVAVGENPCSILVPCHRVVGANRTLTGYGGGFEAKRKLLQIEGFAFDGARESDAKIRIGIGDQTSLDPGA